MKFDLLIKGGQVVDPGGGQRGRLDVAITRNRIAAVESNIPAESAARVIDAGFMGAYVERGTTDKGMVYRVRVKFPSDADAHVAEARLKTYSKDVWITR